ncbi:MAG: hypothetical protein AAF456_14580 [Planctomycetota bacterium]
MRFVFLPVLCLYLLLSGCSNGPDPDTMFAENFDTEIKKLAVLYSTYQAKNSWTGPPDEAQFRSYISSISETRLGRLGITQSDIDGLFISERDGLPYKIRWSTVGGNGVPPKPILFEAEGAEGRYMVGFTNGTSQEFSRDDYDKLWAGEGDDGSMTGFSSGQSRQ